MRALAVAVLGTFAVLGLLGGASAADWPQLFGPQRDGHSKETDLLRHWPEKGPPLLWSKAIGSGWSGPVVAGKQVVLFHRIGSDEVIESLDAETGKSLWQSAYRTAYRDDFNFDDGPRATPTIVGETVFTFGAAGDLHAWHLRDGSKLWHRNVITAYSVRKGYFGAACSPLVVEGRVLLNVGGKQAGIVAFDARTGKELWTATGDGASYSSPALALLHNKPTALFLTRQGFVALDPTTGKVLFTKDWRARIDASVNAATPLVKGDEVFVTSSYNTGALLLRAKNDGTFIEVWSNDESLSMHYNTAVQVGDHLYGVHGRQEARPALRCVEWATGKVRWSKAEFGCASLIAVDGALLALTEEGEIVRFLAQPDGYTETARGRVLNGTVRAAPALCGGILYARDDKQLVAINLRPR